MKAKSGVSQREVRMGTRGATQQITPVSTSSEYNIEEMESYRVFHRAFIEHTGSYLAV